MWQVHWSPLGSGELAARATACLAALIVQAVFGAQKIFQQPELLLRQRYFFFGHHRKQSLPVDRDRVAQLLVDLNFYDHSGHLRC